MKTYAVLTALLCLIMVFTPLCCVGVKNQLYKGEERTQADISVLVSHSDKIIETNAKDYIIGAVAAEMPALYSTEALKAQAVACYTYYKWLGENADNSQTAVGYDISSDSDVHQGYLTDEQMKEKWGEKYESCKKKIEDAVLSVLGECIMYENEPILAVYHAISPGKTQSAETVWGSPLPYLQSVTAVGDTLSPDFDSSAEYTGDELAKALSLKETQGNLIENAEAAPSGYVSKITIGEKSFTGIELSSLLKLKSPCFTAEYKDGKYIFSVKGYGHGVGMSQYSADYMARQGSTYKEILSHFYKGTYIDKIV